MLPDPSCPDPVLLPRWTGAGWWVFVMADGRIDCATALYYTVAEARKFAAALLAAASWSESNLGPRP